MPSVTASAADIRLPGSMARAIAVACEEFLRTGSEIARFTVIVATHDDAFEVIFVPEQEPGRDLLGNSSSAGRETHYWIGSADFRLLRITYGR